MILPTALNNATVTGSGGALTQSTFNNWLDEYIGNGGITRDVWNYNIVTPSTAFDDGAAGNVVKNTPKVIIEE